MGVAGKILNESLLLDLETAPDGKILKVGAICGAEEGFLKGRFRQSDVVQVLDGMAANARFVLGHNILDHDLPVLRRQFPELKIHSLPVIDTLFLSPIAFPENPYHHLVKDYKLLSTALNDPVADARNAAQLFRDQFEVFEKLLKSDAGLVRFYAWAFAAKMEPLFQALDVAAFDDRKAMDSFATYASKFGCATAARTTCFEKREATAYALAWLRVAGANSILPPWVRHRFPEVLQIVHALRDRGCDDPNCEYCLANHNPQEQLQRFFGFDAFRSEPSLSEGGSLQEAIVRGGMNNEPLLAILPTGGGKSLCYQLPALVRNQRLGVLTVVVSPLQALMKDQVDNLNRLTESSFAAALYGMLTPPERGSVLERVRLGDVALLYVSPEQLRNVSFRNVVKQREIGCWVFDEAHCLSRWGHSFRPDYLYASRFIRELAEQQHLECPPVACFTATAKCDVIEEVSQHFEKELSQQLVLFDGGAERTNLWFEVQMVNSAEKETRVLQLLMDRVPEDGASVVYCATRARTEDMAQWLQRGGLLAEAFHAGLEAPEKRRIQDGFIAGDIQHICATNAFGMGIDKDNVRLVVHADIPGSLENYLQEAGRAGRDRESAQCVLLYDEQDIETQFSLSAFSRLTRHDIAQILRGLRRAKRNEDNEVVVTAGEILRDEEVDTEFNTTDPMATTKVNTAVSMLERGSFVQRDENRTNVIQVKPLMQTREEAIEKINALELSDRGKRQWHEIMAQLFDRDPDEAISADQLAELPSMAVAEEVAQYRTLRHDTLPVLKILNDMANAGLVKKDTLLSAYVKVRCTNASDKVLADVCVLEKAMIALLREEEPDAEGWLVLSLRRLNQQLLDKGHASAPESLRSLLGSLAMDGQGLAGRRGSIELKYRDRDHYRIKLQRSWDDLQATAEKRQAVAGIALMAISGKIPEGTNGEHLVEFSESELIEALKADMFVAAQIKDFGSAIERGLLFLHEQRCIILQQGLAIFRSAMTITILPEAKGRRFTAGDFSSLKEHYCERNFQIHVMNRYAALGLDKVQGALALVAAYFTMGKAEFVKRFFPGEQEMLERATSAESYQKIVDQLNNGVQVAVVSARADDNMLVLAGPGSGKTRIIAHRCAYLLRVERVRPREILVVCFNRAAALSLRMRIRELVGKNAVGVTVQTYHGLAMRLVGASLAEHSEKNEETPDFDKMIRDATRLLRGECDLPGLERDEMRERLLAGCRHILIDEYQDINQDQYEMVSAIAGRTLESENEDARLSILAVGDDDQNIYSFQGANIRFIRQFEQDYAAHTHFLVENYRSNKNIIDTANQLVSLNCDRMKTSHPIQINTARRSDPPGETVRIVECSDALHQARFVLEEVKARRCDGSMAVFARTNQELHFIRAALESAGIPVAMASGRKSNIPLHRLRESHALIAFVKGMDQATVSAGRLRQEFHGMEIYEANSPWCRMMDDILVEWEDVTGNNARMPAEAVEFIYEALHELQRDSFAGDKVYLSTVHAAKGLEFDHVAMLGNWSEQAAVEKQEEERRLYYVGMTRARKSLVLCELKGVQNPFTSKLDGSGLRRVKAGALSQPPDDELRLHYSLLDLSDIWIDYPATAPNAGYVRQEIIRLTSGSLVFLDKGEGDNRVFIKNEKGYKIGALSKTASCEWECCLSLVKEVRIHSVVVWRTEFMDHVPAGNCPDEWEVPLLEVVWADGDKLR
ncbi:MAG: RecQ family ATP-dependent DNA helicase [Verrucomicrobiota bacterium]